MPKDSLRDKIDGNELDLSLSNLEIVPVKDLMSLPKATHLDLSCNLLVTLPVEFCQLSHLVRLDLSKNQLTQLPANFGDLAKLQYLDLFQNKLTTLPISLYRLGKLKWLDVKDNPIHDTLKSVAGDCLNETQCKACAKNIVAFMKKAEEQQEVERQAKLQQERELEKKRKAKEEKEKEKIRALKKKEKEKDKERRRKLHEEKLRQEREEQEENAQSAHHNGDALNTHKNQHIVKKEKRGLPCCGVFLACVIGLAAVLCGLYIFCTNNRADKFCQQSELFARQYFNQINATMRFYVMKAQQLMKS